MKDNWIKITNGSFHCNECENDGAPEVVTAEGAVKADLAEIKATLEKFPSKVIYAVCPVCGMEYIFRLEDGELYLEPSEEEK